ncbi:fructose-6-phosphate aldolase [Sporolactobacillus shoreicorticis]|uniref:Fructose-6-phosphate aldolase n=1 Tax=Sporolactobacillus shoreicorticis TaxID=1923877 RepID=A0ABW5RXK7_9BACL|nr:fructose-6-phosphate aldolase [Sporolactobacillus shoreicorticis]MCO7124787.1 fructose-6-phosphate aldolase [Sporolactobacillus shoreicorticis]
MEFLLDTIHLDAIKRYVKVIPLAGVTSNPSIVKKEGKIDLFTHLKTVRSIIGDQASLHVQVVSEDTEGMIKDAHTVLENVDRNVYIKVPVTEAGLAAIKQLKQENVNVTATAIYTKFQGYLAIQAGADYIAPYFNRMENMNIDAKASVAELAKAIERTDSRTKILAASFKNVGQVNAAFEAGAQAATMSADILTAALGMPAINKAVTDFTADWESVFGKGETIYTLAKDAVTAGK